MVVARELSAATVLVVAIGDVDAASAEDLSRRIEGHLSGYRQLVLDLSRLSSSVRPATPCCIAIPTAFCPPRPTSSPLSQRWPAATSRAAAENPSATPAATAILGS